MIYYLDLSFSGVIKYASSICGEFGWSEKWFHGFISNYKKMIAVFNRFRKYTALAYKGRQKWINTFSDQWLISRETWPRSIFVSSVSNSYWPVREALSLGIPCFGVVDTNTISYFITIPLPGNDESMACMVFYNDSVANFILLKKFVIVTNWFYSIRSFNRLLILSNDC
jgi:ribosomal protein S2